MTDPLSNDHPRLILWLTQPTFQAAFAILSLGAIVYFLLSSSILQPYDGMSMDFYVEESEGCALRVNAVYPSGPAHEAGIQIGDEVISIGDRSIECFLSGPLYTSAPGPGEVVEFELRRDGQTATRSLTVGRYVDSSLVLGMVVGLPLMAVALWSVGVVLALFTPPQSAGPRLISLCWLVVGIGVAAGGTGGWISLLSYVTMMAVLPLALLVFVVAHLYFPAPHLTHQWRRVIIYTYTPLALLVSIGTFLEFMVLDPHGFSLSALVGGHAYDIFIAFTIFSFLIGMGLLIHSRLQLRDRNARRQANVILWGTALGGTPYALVMAIDLFASPSSLAYSYASLSLTLVALSYVYVIYQRKLVRIDFAINRVVVLFLLTGLTMTAFALLSLSVVRVFDMPDEVALIGGTAAAIASLLAPSLRQAIQRHVDRLLYGCHYDFATVTGAFSERLVQAVDRQILTFLLAEDLPDQMAIHRAALLLAAGDMLELQGRDENPLTFPRDGDICRALLAIGGPARADSLWARHPDARPRWAAFDWARLFVPLIFQDQLHGLLLLSDRVFGDIYSAADVHIIAAVAHEGALAFENVRLVETLRGLNRRLVREDEAQRKRIARDLHDTALQQLFFVKQGLFRHQDALGTQIDLLDDTIRTLRQTIRGLRPPLLDQGLTLALKGLVDEMRVMAGTSPGISLRSNADGQLPLSDEQAGVLYRIAQEALANALKHAEAKQVVVILEAKESGIRLSIADDGTGAMEEKEGHYGLEGMRERASMIGAQLDLMAIPDQGTRVTIEVPM